MGYPARSRTSLSRPIRDAIRDRIIRAGVTVLDYGCGRGDDVRILRELGYEAFGWDPVLCPAPPPRPAQVVNFGYVLNVIEDPLERQAALAGAFELCNEVLVVSAYVHNGCATKTKLAVPRGDGYVNTRGHFQKLYYHRELGAYIKSCLALTPESADFGVFYVRRDSGGNGTTMDEPVWGTSRDSLLAEFAASYSRPIGKLLKREMNKRQLEALSSHFDSYDVLRFEAEELLAKADSVTSKAYRSVSFGKRTRDALYVHRASVELLPLPLKLLIAKAIQLATSDGSQLTWSVVKISSDLESLTFLNTEPFETYEYPALLNSTRVNLKNRALKLIKESATNPSIYHRKELFFHPSHPLFGTYKQLSEKDERAGLLGRHNIGRRLQWERIREEYHSSQ